MSYQLCIEAMLVGFQACRNLQPGPGACKAYPDRADSPRPDAVLSPPARDVDPPWWSRPGFYRRLMRCPEPVRLIPLSSVVKWSIWSALAGIRRNWPASLNRHRSRSAIGSRKLIALRDAGR